MSGNICRKEGGGATKIFDTDGSNRRSDFAAAFSCFFQPQSRFSEKELELVISDRKSVLSGKKQHCYIKTGYQLIFDQTICFTTQPSGMISFNGCTVPARKGKNDPVPLHPVSQDKYLCPVAAIFFPFSENSLNVGGSGQPLRLGKT